MSAQAPIKIKGFKKPASEDAGIKLSNKRKAAGEVEKEEGENGKKAKESHAPKLKLPGLKVPAAPPPPPVPELSLPGGIAPATMPTSLKLPSPSSASKPAGVVKLGRVPKVPAPPSPAHATTEGTKLKLKTGGARVAQNKVEGESPIVPMEVSEPPPEAPPKGRARRRKVVQDDDDDDEEEVVKPPPSADKKRKKAPVLVLKQPQQQAPPQPPPSAPPQEATKPPEPPTPAPAPAAAVGDDSQSVDSAGRKKKEPDWFAGKLVGSELGRAEIKRGLRDGPAYLSKFQSEQGLEVVPEASPALHMLDLLGVSRPMAYRHVFEDLRRQLEARIDRCANESQLEKLLGNSFAYMTVPELKCIPQRIISKLKAVPPRFLDRLIKKPAMLDDLPLAIKQQAWEADKDLFRRAISDLVTQYVQNRSLVIMPAYDPAASSATATANSQQPSYKVNTHKRREDQRACLDALVQCINKEGSGTNHLEPQAYQYLTDRYRRTGNGAFLTLLADLVILLATARSGKHGMLSRLTLLARCLDDCVREGTIEPRALAQVQNHFRHIIRLCDERIKKARAKAGAAAASAAPKGNDLAKVPPLDKALKESMQFLLHKDRKNVFAKSVVEEYPDLKELYLSKVKEPMDMGLMRQRLRTGHYKDFASFDHDAQLVFKNCMVFNEPPSPFYDMAKDLLNSWTLFKNRFKDVDHKLEMEKMSGGAGGKGGGKGQQAVETDDPPKDPTLVQPLKPRETVQGTPFGHALALLADPFVVQLICRTLSRKLHDVLKSQSLPKDHALVPSLLQLLVMALTARTQLDPKHGDSHFFVPSAVAGPVADLLHHLLPTYLELCGYHRLMNKYGVAGWDNQPVEKEEMQDRVRACIDRLYRLCKKAAMPPLTVRVLQQCLVDSAGLLEDHRTDNLAEMLKRLYAYCRKKETQASQSTGVEPTAAYRPDPHDRFLWAALATACTRRVMVTTVPLEKGLRDRLLDVFGQELPHTRSPPLTSWLHEHLIRLIREWAAKNVLKPDEVTQHLTSKVLAVEGTLLNVWDKPAFEPHRQEYEKLFEAQEGLREIMLVEVPEEEEEEEGDGAGEKAEDGGGQQEE